MPAVLSATKTTYHFQSIHERALERAQLSARKLRNQWKANLQVYMKVFGHYQPQIKVLHPRKPLLVADCGFSIRIQDFDSIGGAGSSLSVEDMPEGQETNSIWANSPFIGQVTRIESLSLSEEYVLEPSSGLRQQFLFAVMKTRSEQPYQLSKYHLVIYDMSDLQQVDANQQARSDRSHIEEL